MDIFDDLLDMHEDNKPKIDQKYSAWVYRANELLKCLNCEYLIGDGAYFTEGIWEDDCVDYRQYGNYTYDDINKILLNKYNIDQIDIDEAINCVKVIGQSIRSAIIDRLTSKIIEKNELDATKFKIIQDELKDLFYNVCSNMPILASQSLGYYFKKHFHPCTTFYTGAIYTYAQSIGVTYEQVFEEIFIRELFRAYYKCYKIEAIKEYITESIDEYNWEKFKARKDYTSQVVEESLVAYFEYKYLEKYNYTIAMNHLMSNWIKYSPYCFPSSGAYELVINSDFHKIVNISIGNTDLALRKLLRLDFDIDVFYMIKNKSDTTIRYSLFTQDLYADSIKSLNKFEKGKNNIYISNNICYESGSDSFINPSKYKFIEKLQNYDLIFHIFKNHFYSIIYSESKCFKLDRPLDISVLTNYSNYLNDNLDNTYVTLCKDYSIIKDIVNLYLKNYPNEAFFIKLKEILN